MTIKRSAPPRNVVCTWRCSACATYVCDIDWYCPGCGEKFEEKEAQHANQANPAITAAAPVE